MHSILVLNAKGGCGKTTLATNLASNYALRGHRVSLADFDPQCSSLQWLAARPARRPPITGFAAGKEAIRTEVLPDYLIMDAPAGVRDRLLTHFVRNADTIIVPVLPSPIDIRAAARFMGDLLLNVKLAQKPVKLAVVANRVRDNTVVFQKLQRFLRSLEVPFAATLREAQHYVRAAQEGLGIFELPPASVAHNLAHWQPLLEWIETGELAGVDKIQLQRRQAPLPR